MIYEYKQNIFYNKFIEVNFHAMCMTLQTREKENYNADDINVRKQF